MEKGWRHRVTGNEAPPPPKPGLCALIGPRVRCQGALRGTGDLCVQGNIVGSLASGGTITVDPGGQVEGDLRARNVVVVGTVRGNLWTREVTTLGASGDVEGDVETGRLVVTEGAVFNGRVSMVSTDQGPRQIPPGPTSLTEGVHPQAVGHLKPFERGRVMGGAAGTGPSGPRRSVKPRLRPWLYPAIVALAALLLLLRLLAL